VDLDEARGEEVILDRILEHKRAELRRKKSRGYLAELKAKIRDGGAPLEFSLALEAASRPSRPALIAEVKKASPSKGLMREDFADGFDPVKIAQAYKANGAVALSVLTDDTFFQGSLDDLQRAKTAAGLPTLNKEFMLDELQFYEARAHGADAVLLIVAALERKQLVDFFALARELSLDVLVETHDERELDTVLEWLPEAGLIGINNRDLKTFATDLAVTFRLAKRVPAGKLIVSESGIQKRDDVLRLSEAGVRAVLVGEALLQSDDPGAKVRELLGAEP
jgi:indole-3-glycerol phosphate synthase